MTDSPVAGGSDEHLRALLAVVLPFARDTIAEHGEFYPFGVTMLPDGELQTAATWTGEERPSAEEVLEVVRADLRRRAEAGELLATGVAAGVEIGVGDYDTGIRVELEHRDGDAVTWVIPYRADDDGYAEGEPFAVAAERRTWDGPSDR